MKKIFVSILCAVLISAPIFASACNNNGNEELSDKKLAIIANLNEYVQTQKEAGVYDERDSDVVAKIITNITADINKAEDEDTVDKLYHNAVTQLNGVETVDKYKLNSIADITQYINDLTDSGFYNWNACDLLTDIINQAIYEINSAESKDMVDKVILQIRQQAEAVETVRRVGQFVTLREAFEKGYITHSDLLEISDYHANYPGAEIDDEKAEYAIKQSFVELNNEEFPDKTVDDVVISSYFGNYNGFYVLQIDNFDAHYPDVMYDYIVDEVVIAVSGPEPIAWYLI